MCDDDHEDVAAKCEDDFDADMSAKPDRSPSRDGNSWDAKFAITQKNTKCEPAWLATPPPEAQTDRLDSGTHNSQC